RDPDQTELAHLVEDVAVDLLLQIGLDDARQELVLRIGARGVADHALVLGELLVEQEWIVPLEARRGRLVLGLRTHAHENSFHIATKGIVHQSKALRVEAQLNWASFIKCRPASQFRKNRREGISPRASHWRRSLCRSRTIPCSRASTKSNDGSRSRRDRAESARRRQPRAIVG